MTSDPSCSGSQHKERLASLLLENEALRRELNAVKFQLISNEECYRSVFEDAPLAYHSLQQDGSIRTVSQGWLELFGCTRAQAVGKPFRNFVAPEYHAALQANLHLLLGSGRSSNFECVGLRGNGETFSLSIDGMAVREAGGRFRCTHCLLRDITAQKTAQGLLQESERFYHKVFDTAAIPIGIVRDLVILYANPQMAKSVGCADPDLLVGLSLLSFLPSHEIPKFADRARRRARGEQVPNQYEAEICRQDGSCFPVLATVSTIQLGDGPATLGFFQDISEHRRIAQSLLKSETRFRRLFDEVSAIAVQGYDQQRRVIYWNAASEVLYGYSRAEAMGRRLEELIIPPPMRPFVVEHIRAWVEEDQAIPPGELELMRKDGSMVPVFSSHVMQNVGGRRELYCLDMDLSELHAAKQELTRARDAAEAANNAKSEFLANMSHEIRTPMNGVLGMLQLLMDSPLAGEQRDYVELAFQSSRRLLGLLNDILDFSRIESGKMNLVQAPMRLHELFDSVHRVFALNAQQRGLALTMDVDESISRPLLADEARLRQILFNLVGNAIKFTRHGSVHVQAWAAPQPGAADPQTSRRVYLCVSDTGEGIPEDKLSVVFDRFTQNDSSYTRRYEGAGLGLAIVKRIVELMGGNIVLDSEVGQGTSVCVQLPLTLVPAETASPAHPPASPARIAAALSVLVAEDDQINQLFIWQQLLRLGHQVVLAANGQEAVEAVRNKPFDCVLMDVQMPVLDGLEATAAIRALDAELNRPRTHIIALTAYTLSGDRDKFLAAGMDDYISKPLHTAELTKALERVQAEKRPAGGQ